MHAPEFDIVTSIGNVLTVSAPRSGSKQRVPYGLTDVIHRDDARGERVRGVFAALTDVIYSPRALYGASASRAALSSKRGLPGRCCHDRFVRGTASCEGASSIASSSRPPPVITP